MARQTLNMAQGMKLGNLIVDEYVKAGMNDEQFAEYVSERLSFKVAASNVAGLRRQLGIESNYKAKVRDKKKSTAFGRIEELEARVTDLQQRVANLEIYAKALQANRSH